MADRWTLQKIRKRSCFSGRGQNQKLALVARSTRVLYSLVTETGQHARARQTTVGSFRKTKLCPTTPRSPSSPPARLLVANGERGAENPLLHPVVPYLRASPSSQTSCLPSAMRTNPDMSKCHEASFRRHFAPYVKHAHVASWLAPLSRKTSCTSKKTAASAVVLHHSSAKTFVPDSPIGARVHKNKVVGALAVKSFCRTFGFS